MFNNLGSMSDVYGGRCVYLISLSMFLVTNILRKTLPASLGALYTLHVFQAIGSSSVYCVGMGTIIDITPLKKRAGVLDPFMMGPILGYVIGPIISAMAFERHWKSSFLLLSIFTGVALVFIWMFVPETSRSVVGSGQYFIQGPYKRTLFQKRVIPNDELPNQKLTLMFLFHLLRHRAVFWGCVCDAITFSTLYTVLTTFGPVLKESFHWSTRQVAWAYLGPGLGFLIFSITCKSFINFSMSEEENSSAMEELLIDVQLATVFCEVAGLVMYGWFKTAKLPVLAYCGIVALTAGESLEMMGTSIYLTECVDECPAAVLGFNSVIRTCGGFLGSFIVNKIVAKIGLGWCFTTYSLVSIVTLFFSSVVIGDADSWRDSDGYLLN